MTVREQIQQRERETLSPYAAFSDATRGRDKPETECDLRTPYQRDRDRVIHCKSFRRLKHKTQVFLAPEGDHYRTRLTHTLEVSQIARTIARALRLNEDLTEAASLAHDLGHTPFGHAGERALNALITGGFRHYEQSVRVVDRLEKDGRGLNLTYEVKNAMLCHTSGEEAVTAEGKIIRWADKIAYMNHDIDDAIRAGMLREEDIPKSITDVLGNSKTKRITALIRAVVEHSSGKDIGMDDGAFRAFEELHAFLFQAVYLNDYAKSEERKVPHIIESLYKHFLNPDFLPDYMKEIAEREGKEIASCDYVAGMTDHYAIACYQELFIPKAWDITD